MPDINEFIDIDDMENNYIGKCVIYVEGKDDQKVWEAIVGSEFADRLEFKVPLAEGSGSEVVINRVSDERPKNPKIFGLVDGEVAAQFGEVTKLINCSDVLFQLQIQQCSGILFLSAHEMENVLIGHSSFVEFAEYNATLKSLGERTRNKIKKYLLKQAKRFYLAALLKYTWAHMYFLKLTPEIDKINFMSDHSVCKEIKNAKQSIKQKFSDNGQEFERQLMQIAYQMRKRRHDIKREGGSVDQELVRLADGKSLLNNLRREMGFKKANDGLLVQRVISSDFASKFREKLIDMTGA